MVCYHPDHSKTFADMTLDEAGAVVRAWTDRYQQPQSDRRQAQTIHDHWDNFIKMLSERGLTDDQIGLILGGNYLRLWKQILPSA